MKRTLLFAVNDLHFFGTHRLPIALAAQREGYEVHIAAPAGGGEELAAEGLTIHHVHLNRGGMNPLDEVRGFFDLFKLMVRLKPDLVHLVTSKPIIYGGVAARLARMPAVVSAISGLGYVFTADTAKVRVLRFGVTQLYRLALAHKNINVIFQNKDDLALLADLKIVDKNHTTLIEGSGVSLSDYPFLPEPEGVPNVAFVARLLGDKGIFEFMEAIRLLNSRGVSAHYTVVGDPDPRNPTAVSVETLHTWKHENIARFVGFQTDVAAQLAAANIVVLPSYREGLPKVLAEAASSGRAVVTTDVPGCREAIEPGRTGLLVPVRDSVALADAIERLVTDKTLRTAMGLAGRQLAESTFDIEKIVASHMAVYRAVVTPVISNETAKPQIH